MEQVYKRAGRVEYNNDEYCTTVVASPCTAATSAATPRAV